MCLLALAWLGLHARTHADGSGLALHFGILGSYGRLGITYGIDLAWTGFLCDGRLVDTHTPLMGEDDIDGMDYECIYE